MQKKKYIQPEFKLHQFNLKLLDSFSAITVGPPNQDAAAKRFFFDIEEDEEDDY